MATVDLQISLRCAACASVVPVNAFVGEVTCWSCERRTTLDGSVWQLLLETPLREGPSLGARVEQSTTLQSHVGTFERAYHNGDPTCHACRTPISADALRALASQLGAATNKTAHCPECNHGVLVRPAPPSLAAVGVAAMVGESSEQLAGAAAAKQPMALACTACGGSLSVDGSQRSVVCRYCSATQYLPEGLWISLRSTPVTQWSLVLTEAASAARRAAPQVARWTSLHHVIADPQGNLYLLGLPTMTDGGDREALKEVLTELLGGGGESIRETLWCIGPDGTLRWQRSGMPYDFRARIAWSPSGHVLLAQGSRCELVQASDGATVHRFGQDGPALHMSDVESLVYDSDGSIVALDGEGHLLRWDARGTPMAAWGTGAPEKQKTGEGTWVNGLGRKPIKIYKGMLGQSFDGHLWVQSSIPYDELVHLAYYARSGSHERTVSVPVPKSTLVHHPPAVDARGAAYVLAKHLTSMGSEYTVLRVEPGEKRGREWIVPMSRGGFIGRENKMAVAADGTLFLLGDDSQLRRFGPDGRPQFVSQTSANANRALV